MIPNEYYAEVFGGEISDACEFGSLGQANELLGLMMWHWNTIAATLFKGEVYVPLLLEDDNGVVHGNDWARGFMWGMHMRHYATPIWSMRGSIGVPDTHDDALPRGRRMPRDAFRCDNAGEARAGHLWDGGLLGAYKFTPQVACNGNLQIKMHSFTSQDPSQR